jgi:hypothetical protein
MSLLDNDMAHSWEIAKAVADMDARRTAKRKPDSKPNTKLRVAIAVAPSTSMRLTREVELVKSALLYAEEVVLCSGATTLLSGVSALTQLNREQKVKFLVELLPRLQPESAPKVEMLRQLLDRRRHGGEQWLSKLRAEAIFNEYWRGTESAAMGLLEEAGAAELDEPLRSGTLKLELLHSSKEGMDGWMDVYLQRLNDYMCDPRSYPLFDDETGKLVRAGEREGFFTLTDRLVERATQTGISSGLISGLPTFANSSMGQVLGSC